MGTISLDLSDPARYLPGEPHATWRMLRAEAPVRWHPAGGDQPGYWSITRYRDVERILKDPASFSSEGGTILDMRGRPEPAAGHQFVTTDPPRHTALRRPVQQLLTTAIINGRATGFRRDIDRLLHAVPDRFDLTSVTVHLPRIALAPLLGIPDVDWPLLERLMCMVKAETEPEYMLAGGPRATLDRAHRELFAYLLDLVSRQRRQPSPGTLTAALLNLNLAGRPLGAGAIVANCYDLLSGAVAVLGEVPNVALAELAEHGGYAGWACRPDLLRGGVEEALRMACPARHLMRRATKPVRLHGKLIEAGDAVVVWLGSANRDGERFAEPGTFDPARSPNRHLSFGVGPHTCIGAALARSVLHAFFAALFERFADLRLAGEVRRVRSNWLAGVKTLPVQGIQR